MSLKAIVDATTLRRILKTISGLKEQDLKDHDAWEKLARLSTNTALSAIEAYPKGVYDMGDGTDGTFEAVATVYLTLNAGSSSAFSNSLPAHIHGRVNTDNTVQVEKIEIDTSSLDPSGPSQMSEFRTS